MNTNPPTPRLACGRCGGEVSEAHGIHLGRAVVADQQAVSPGVTSVLVGDSMAQNQHSCPRCRRACRAVPRELSERSPTVGTLILTIAACTIVPLAVFAVEFRRYNGTPDGDLIGVWSGGSASLLFPFLCFAIFRGMKLEIYPDRVHSVVLVLGALLFGAGRYAVAGLVMGPLALLLQERTRRSRLPVQLADPACRSSL
jgi:hypothetical protein